MARTLRGLAVISFLAAPALVAPFSVGAAADQKVAWDDASHKLFFNYQRYLLKLDLSAQTQESWDALLPPTQAKLLNETETFLKSKITRAMNADYLSLEDENLIAAVWGDGVKAAVVRVSKARGLADPAQVQKAVAQATSLIKTMGGVKVDWTALFDGGAKSGLLSDDVPHEKAKDYLAVPKKNDFLESLASPETAKVLATAESFSTFLQKKLVAQEAVPGLMAMYQVLGGPPTPQTREMQHLLPTVVAYLNEGKPVFFNSKADTGAFGSATPGPLDDPLAVEVTGAAVAADPLLVGKTLAHEFQHVYDMYMGRYYTLDSEMRGFKVAVLYVKTLKARAPVKYDSLVHSDNDETRQYVREIEAYSREFDESPAAFRDGVALRYQTRNEGGFAGRQTLRATVDPRLDESAVGDLGAQRRRLAVKREEVAKLEIDYTSASEAFTREPNSRTLSHELEKVTKDLEAARLARDKAEQTVTIQTIRLKRMQQEVAWLDANAAAQGRTPDAYDLTLAVDRGYAPK